MDTSVRASQANQVAGLDKTKDTAVPVFSLRGHANAAMVSSGGKGEDSNLATHADCGCADTIHELANSMTAVLINVQALEWKLPPYSRLKRLVREIERHAQRSGALLKRLREFAINPSEAARGEFCRPVPCLHGTMAAVTARELGGDRPRAGDTAAPGAVASASAPGSSRGTELTLICDPCTSAFFPKEER